MLDAKRLFPAEATARAVAVKLYETVRDLPIISPHGHTDHLTFRTSIAPPVCRLLRHADRHRKVQRNPPQSLSESEV